MSYKPLFIGTALFFILGAAVIVVLFGCSAGNADRSGRGADSFGSEQNTKGEEVSTVVVYNTRSQQSFQAALTYIEEHNIWMINMCAVNVPVEKDISWEECEALIVRNIKDTLMMLGDQTITDVVFSYDIPDVINPRPSHIDSSLDRQISHIGKDDFHAEKSLQERGGFAMREYSVARIEKNRALLLSYNSLY